MHESISIPRRPNLGRVTQSRSVWVVASMCLLSLTLVVVAQQPGQVEAPADAPPPAAPLLDDLAVKQGKIADKYARLEQLLIRMSELEATSNPQRAALLKRAAQQSSEKLTRQQLNTLVKLLVPPAQLKRAVDEQRQIVTDLKALLDLLQSENRADRLKSEQARVKDYIKEVERLIRLQQGIQGRTEGGDDTQKLAKDQEQIGDRTGQLAKRIQENEEGSKTGGKTADESKSDDKKSDQDKSGDADKSDPAKSNQEKSQGDKAGEKNKSGKNKSGKDKSGKDKSGKDQDGKDKDGNDKDATDKSEKSPPEKEPNDKGESDDPSKQPSDKSADGKGEPNSKKQKSGTPKSSSKGKKSGDPKGKSQEPGEPSESPESEPQPAPEQPQPEQDEGNPARKRLQAAEDRMRDAQRKLSESKQKDATAEQENAREELEKAKAELEQILRQMREEEIERTLAMLEGRFRRMLESQLKIYESTKRLDKIPAAQRSRDVDIQASKLGFEQGKLAVDADKALLVLREEGSSVAFPETVEMMRDDMQQVADRLSVTQIDTVTQGVEEEIVQTLEELIAALQKAQQDLKDKKPPPPMQPQPQDPSQRALVDQLAELRMIRALQMRVNSRTQRFSRLLKNTDDPVGRANDEDLRQSLVKLAELEKRVHEITRNLVLGKNE